MAIKSGESGASVRWEVNARRENLKTAAAVSVGSRGDSVSRLVNGAIGKCVVMKGSAHLARWRVKSARQVVGHEHAHAQRAVLGESGVTAVAMRSLVHPMMLRQRTVVHVVR